MINDGKQNKTYLMYMFVIMELFVLAWRSGCKVECLERMCVSYFVQ